VYSVISPSGIRLDNLGRRQAVKLSAQFGPGTHVITPAGKEFETRGVKPGPRRVGRSIRQR
jgi:hypothetical protein